MTSSFVQIVALSACLAVRLITLGDFQMPGMRRAMQTIAAAGVTMICTDLDGCMICT